MSAPPRERLSRMILPGNTLCTSDIMNLAKLAKIPHFSRVKMRDQFHGKSRYQETGVLNLSPSTMPGSHWCCYYRNGKERYYFDSYGESPPVELLRYLKSDREMEENSPVIVRNLVTVQHDNSSECGALCLYVLKRLSQGVAFTDIIDYLEKRYQKHPTPPLKCTP